MPRKYAKGAQKKVKKAMHERKEGILKSGGSGKNVNSRNQTIAIGLSEARAEGKKVPAKKASKKAATKKTGAKKTASKRVTTKKAANKKLLLKSLQQRKNKIFF